MSDGGREKNFAKWLILPLSA
jgi:PhnB protein